MSAAIEQQRLEDVETAQTCVSQAAVMAGDGTMSSVFRVFLVVEILACFKSCFRLNTTASLLLTNLSFVFAAWSLVLPVLRQLAENEIGTRVKLPGEFERMSRQVDPALAHLHHHGVLMYDTRKQSVTVWSKVMRDSLREGKQRTSSVAL